MGAREARRRRPSVEATQGSLNGFVASLRNLGPVREANLRLGDVTVVESRNSFGKTFLTTSISALEQVFRYSESRLIQILAGSHLSDVVRRGLRRRGGRLLPSLDSALSPNAEERLVELISEDLARDEVGLFLANVFLSSFGGSPSQAISFGSRRAEAELKDESFGSVRVRWTRKGGRVALSLTPSFVRARIRQTLAELRENAWLSFLPMGEPTRARMDRVLPMEAIARFTRQILPPIGTLVVPAERIGLMPLFLSPAEAVSRAEGRGADLSSQAVASLIHPAVRTFASFCHAEFSRRFDSKDRFSKEAEVLVGAKVQALEGGRVQVKMGEQVVHPLFVSSSISQLTLLAAAIESPAVSSIYIEEPEINLHPDKVLGVARYVWGLSKPTFVTTHSQDFLALLAQLASRGINDPSHKVLRAYELTPHGCKPLGVDERGQIDAMSAYAESAEEILAGVTRH